MRDEAVDVVPARRIRVEEDAALAEQRSGLLAAFARIASHVPDDDARALVGEPQRDRAAEPRGAAGDDRDPLLETPRHPAYPTTMAATAHPFTLEQIDGDPVSLDTLIEDGPVVLVFAHGDCPTSTLALRRLAGLPADAGITLVCVAEETPEAAARLARRTGVRFPVLAERSPFAVSQAYGIETVPTAVRIDPGAGVTGTVVGWDADAYATILDTSLPDEEPRRKPGCGARWTYDAAGGLDELEDMIERGWSDGLPVVPPTPERVEAMLGGRDPALSLGPVPPAHGEATLERLAACAPCSQAAGPPSSPSCAPQPRLRWSPASTRTESPSRPSRRARSSSSTGPYARHSGSTAAWARSGPAPAPT